MTTSGAHVTRKPSLFDRLVAVILSKLGRLLEHDEYAADDDEPDI